MNYFSILTEMPNTSSYMWAGYGIVFGGIFLYVVSLLLRTYYLQRQRQRLLLLLKKDELYRQHNKEKAIDALHGDGG